MPGLKKLHEASSTSRGLNLQYIDGQFFDLALNWKPISSELKRGDLVVEQMIKLLERKASHLRNGEECPNNCDEGERTPYKALKMSADCSGRSDMQLTILPPRLP